MLACVSPNKCHCEGAGRVGGVLPPYRDQARSNPLVLQEIASLDEGRSFAMTPRVSTTSSEIASLAGERSFAMTLMLENSRPQ